LARYRQ